MHILVIQLKRIGDAILTTSLLAALRDHVPGCRITLVLDAATAALEPALGADRTLIFRRGKAGLSFWHALAAGGFDACLDLTGNDRSAMATALSRATRRVTWERFAKKPLRRIVYNEFIDSSVKNRHTADHYTDLLRAFGIQVENVPLALHLPQAAREEAERALAEAGISPPFAVVHAGTARAEKYWEAGRWAKTIQVLQTECRLTVVLTGSADSVERTHLDDIQRKLSEPCPDLAGRLSLLGTAAVIQRARLVCAVDSAPVHLADALGTPLVALFGPTNPFHWRPRRIGSRIVTAANAGEFAPDFPKAPMSDIRTESVLTAIRDLL
jgi:ADP-heptose:LPS heptosyltransferase